MDHSRTIWYDRGEGRENMGKKAFSPFANLLIDGVNVVADVVDDWKSGKTRVVRVNLWAFDQSPEALKLLNFAPGVHFRTAILPAARLG